ncbi:Kinesin light chain, partial [Durusdinium trenchii]
MGAALLREETEAKPVRSRRSLPSLPEAALVPAPSGLAPLAAYFSCSYLKGEAFGDGSYVTILEEVCQHSVERFVEFFDHQPSHTRVWSEVLDLRLAQPNMAAMVLFHYTTRDGLWSLLDYQQPIGEAMKALAEKAALATREPSQLAAVDPRLRYCLPLLVPQSCCKGPVDRSPNDMLITFGDKELQCANMHGWTCLRPKRLDR